MGRLRQRGGQCEWWECEREWVGVGKRGRRGSGFCGLEDITFWSIFLYILLILIESLLHTVGLSLERDGVLWLREESVRIYW